MIGVLLIAAFWAAVVALRVSGRRIPGLALGVAVLATLIAALALQPASDAAGWIALGLTAAIATAAWLHLPPS
jgi:hypothetical protein